MRHAWLEEAQAGIKIAGRNTNNLRYADDTTLMAESEQELKSLLMKGKEESEKWEVRMSESEKPRPLRLAMAHVQQQGPTLGKKINTAFKSSCVFIIIIKKD